MAKKFEIPFAFSGDKTAVPVGVQPDGSVSYTNGFGPDYELDKLVDPVNAKDVPRDQTNQLFFDTTDAIGELQEKGFAPWSNDMNYAAKAFALGPTNGLLYVALQASGPSTTARNPETEPTYWERFALRGMIAFTSAGVTAWTVPLAMQLGIIKPKVTVTGAGGGGSKISGTTGVGGGGGGTTIGVVDLTGVTSVSITVGTPGAAAAGSAPSAGSNGGTSSFGAFLSATGGAGGNTAGNKAVGGAGTGGLINLDGGSANGVLGNGDGGGSYWGQGGLGPTSGSGVGSTGYTFGAGGAGSSGNLAAGGGSVGIVVIEW
jgi:hypothetical protein